MLERLAGELCDAVTGRPGGRAMLELLDRANLFLVPLDDRRQWYRYHHLFADVLRAHLDDEHPGEARTLHRRASDWYAQADEPVAAVRHRSPPRMSSGPPTSSRRRYRPSAGRGRRRRCEPGSTTFPTTLIRRRPVLALGLVGGLMQYNDFAAGRADAACGGALAARHPRPAAPEPEADDRAAGTDAPTAGDLVFLDEGALAKVPATVAMYHAAFALVHGDPAATIRHAGLALARAAPGDHLARGAAEALSGLACWTGGDLEAAHRWYRDPCPT